MGYVRMSTVGLTLAAALLNASPGFTQTEGESESLRGLTRVHLALRSVDGASEQGALAVEPFRPGIVGLLAQGGVLVVDAEELQESTGAAYLSITVRSDLAGKNRVYAIDLRVKQMATLVRAPAVPRPLTTWFVGDLGLTPVGDDREIGNAIDDLVTRFVVARHQANPE